MNSSFFAKLSSSNFFSNMANTPQLPHQLQNPAVVEQILLSIFLFIVSLLALKIPLSIKTIKAIILSPHRPQALITDIGKVNVDEAQEREFSRLYSEIQSCGHNRLVLPPSCRKSREKVGGAGGRVGNVESEEGQSIISRVSRSATVTVSNLVDSIAAVSGRKKEKNLNLNLSELAEEEEEEGKGESEEEEEAAEMKKCEDTAAMLVSTPAAQIRRTATHPMSAPPREFLNDVANIVSSASAKIPPTHTHTHTHTHTQEEQEPPYVIPQVVPVGKPESLNFFDVASNDKEMRRMTTDSALPDKNGYVFDSIPEDCTPILAFVNSRSGGNQGVVLQSQLKRVLNPCQVWDLADGGPEKVLESFIVLAKLRILVCGGDGTVAWILDALEKMKVERLPPMAILPLGTGNDLARIHGWGGGYNNESLLGILEDVANSYVSLLDRWEMVIEQQTTRKSTQEVKTFNNYIGFGSDAQAALDFHKLRENKPEVSRERSELVTTSVWCCWRASHN